MKNESKEWYWNSIETDVIIGGLRVGQLGSLKRILNDNDEPITTGYHSFYMQDGSLYGQLGATDERVTYESPDQIRILEDRRDRRDQDLINEIINRRKNKHLIKNMSDRRESVDHHCDSSKHKPIGHYRDVFFVAVFLTIIVLSVI